MPSFGQGPGPGTGSDLVYLIPGLSGEEPTADVPGIDHWRTTLIRNSVLPVKRHGGVVRFIVGGKRSIPAARELAAELGVRAEVIIDEHTDFARAVPEAFRDHDAREIAWRHALTRPAESAARTLTPAQKSLAVVALAVLSASLLAPLQALIAIIALVTGFYLITALYKSALVLRTLSRSGDVGISRDELLEVSDANLPVYTILVPLYRESNMVPQLIDAISGLDYPKSRLDVKLLLEEDDRDTRAAVDSLRLPPYFHTLVVPEGQPKGKPRACNYGLLYARGSYCVIFDAEDRPEPDQLKKAVLAFSKSDRRTACVQAKLNFYNADQNLLTKWFTAEYSTWFDLYLPGLVAFRAPIPLGGTSNHFKIDVLREVGAWDPFNVTEDADLGLRLARHGYETAVIDSTTYEEANSHLGNWIRQRSRWIKGYMQTGLVHMRSPLGLLSQLGPLGFLGFQVMVLGTVMAYFANPLFWALVAVWYATGSPLIESMYPGPVLYMSAVSLFAGNFVFVYAGLAGCLRRDYYQGVKYALLSPLYWLLMSVAAWKAIFQLLSRPHYWEKTRHGLIPVASSERAIEGAVQ
jgi:cellulose synthase/poly-beta-1,6-N-acetylglucosamine synthase-like glycosyltransferase